MRIVVAAAHPADSLKAHAINTVKMAAGFHRLGHDVTVVVVAGEGPVDAAGFAERYAVSEEIELVQVSRRRDRLGRRFDPHMRFARRAMRAVQRIGPDALYARSFAVPLLAARAGLRVALESHAPVGTATKAFGLGVQASRLPAFRAWTTISPVLADYYASVGVPRSRLLVLPDAVDCEQFTPPPEPTASPYDGPGPRLVYAGHLYDYKGIPTVIDAATRLPGVRFELVGGTPRDVERQRDLAARRGAANVRFHGQQDQRALPPYLWHADAALLPPSAQHPSAQWTSPVKLGEYLAAGKPVIASDIPALRHWLTDREVIFFAPDRGDALAEAIEHCLGHAAEMRRRAQDGQRLAARMSYARRAQAIWSRLGEP